MHVYEWVVKNSSGFLYDSRGPHTRFIIITWELIRHAPSEVWQTCPQETTHSLGSYTANP